MKTELLELSILTVQFISSRNHFSDKVCEYIRFLLLTSARGESDQFIQDSVALLTARHIMMEKGIKKQRIQLAQLR